MVAHAAASAGRDLTYLVLPCPAMFVLLPRAGACAPVGKSGAGTCVMSSAMLMSGFAISARRPATTWPHVLNMYIR
jgi:hypothetical protein